MSVHVKMKRPQKAKSKLSTVDLAGSGSKHSIPRKMKRFIDKMRKEDA
jgi:hypothetical protein